MELSGVLRLGHIKAGTHPAFQRETFKSEQSFYVKPKLSDIPFSIINLHPAKLER